MKKTLSLLLLMILIFGVVGVQNTVEATTVPAVFKQKFPREQVDQIKNVDLDNDRKNETIILSKQGNLFIIKNKNVQWMARQIISEEDFPPPQILTFKPSKNEVHVVAMYYYGPSNTQAYVYRLSKGKAKNVLNIMGDQAVKISGYNIIQKWKKYRDGGGWDMVVTTYSWNTKQLKYVSKGIKP
ncbi:hypothetical protein [Priestia koreensis]|uniref:Uncharacterized protein n=1 Tax=Priestia koreensis TaxID=284581 RepID=A0A0M0KEF9_9BACI|nr:hypothetical protein [Priestia koreensis]KOO37230.1 hypothetical protein AMD01_22405 [Priestia koreensis]